MTKVTSFIHGIYPRSDTLAQVSRDVDRKRKNLTDLQHSQKKDLNSLIKKQQKFLFVEDGKLSWQDIFRPIVETAENVSEGTLTRWFDNNAFFRKPLITGKMRINEEKIKNYFPKISKNGKWKVTIPSPYLFAKLSESEKDFASTLEQTTSVIKDLIVYLDKLGVAFIQLNEPAVVYYETSKKEKELFVHAISKLASTKRISQLAVHFYFGDCAPIVAELVKAKVPLDAIGVDFVKTNLTSLPTVMPYAIIAGIIEGRNSLLEKEQNLKSFVKKLIKAKKTDVLYLTNNSDLQFLPEKVAAKKVELLEKLQRSFSKNR